MSNFHLFLLKSKKSCNPIKIPTKINASSKFKCDCSLNVWQLIVIFTAHSTELLFCLFFYFFFYFKLSYYYVFYIRIHIVKFHWVFFVQFWFKIKMFFSNFFLRVFCLHLKYEIKVMNILNKHKKNWKTTKLQVY